MNRLLSCAMGLAALGALTLPAAGGTELIINELDADTPGTDELEFIEIYDGGVGNTDLTGLVLVQYNGFDSASYAAHDLDGFSTGDDGYFVVGNELVPNVGLVIPNNSVQNGADAVALYTGDAADFPDDTPVTAVDLLDAIVYGTNDDDATTLIDVLLNAKQEQVNESGAGNSSRDSNQRCPNGEGGQRNTDTYLQNLPSPGADNACIVEPTGACCDLETFECTDGVFESDCQGEMQEFTQDVLCVNLDPQCDAEAPVGACCDDASGNCSDGLKQSDCEDLGRRWGGADSTCVDIDPPCTAAEPGNLLITEIVDAPLPGGQPKWVEVTNCDTESIDLSLYSLGNFNNGGLELGGGESTRLGDVLLAPGDSYVVGYEFDTNRGCDPDVTCFEFVYKLAPDQFIGPFINGNDVMALFLGTATGDGTDATLVDVYGVIGVDGVGEVWEYTDSYASRNAGAEATDTFDDTEWTFGGAEALETGDDEEELALARKLTHPYENECEDGGDCDGDTDGNNAVDFDDLLAVLSEWGPTEDCPPFVPADFDEDCDVDFDDLLVVLSNWGPCK